MLEMKRKLGLWETVGKKIFKHNRDLWISSVCIYIAGKKLFIFTLTRSGFIVGKGLVFRRPSNFFFSGDHPTLCSGVGRVKYLVLAMVFFLWFNTITLGGWWIFSSFLYYSGDLKRIMKFWVIDGAMIRLKD